MVCDTVRSAVKNTKWLDPIQRTAAGAVDDAVDGRLWTTLLIVHISRPAIFMPFGGPLKRTWLAGYLKQRPTWSRLSLPGCRHLTTTSFVLGYKFWSRLRHMIKCKGWVWAGLMCSICYLCVTCTVTSESAQWLHRKVLGIGVFLTLFCLAAV